MPVRTVKEHRTGARRKGSAENGARRRSNGQGARIAAQAEATGAEEIQYIRITPEIGRNDPCPAAAASHTRRVARSTSTRVRAVVTESRSSRNERIRLLGCQPSDGDQMLDGVKFRIARQDRSRQTSGRGDAKGIRVGDRMLALDLRRVSHQWQVHRHQLDGQLFQEMEGFSGADRADLALDDVEELAPIDPVEKGLGPCPLLFIQGGADLFPTGLLMKEADQRETIEDEFFAHGGPPLDARDGDRPSRRTCR